MNEACTRINKLVAVFGGWVALSVTPFAHAGVWSTLYEKMRDPKAAAPSAEVQKWTRDKETKKAAAEVRKPQADRSKAAPRVQPGASPSGASKVRLSTPKPKSTPPAALKPKSAVTPQAKPLQTRERGPAKPRGDQKQALPGISGEGIPGKVEF